MSRINEPCFGGKASVQIAFLFEKNMGFLCMYVQCETVRDVFEIWGGRNAAAWMRPLGPPRGTTCGTTCGSDRCRRRTRRRGTRAPAWRVV